MEGQGGEQMCPVCTLYLRPGMTLHDHLFTHPKDQVIDALVRLAISPGSLLSGAATINTNSQFTAITYRQFQTLTTSVPEPTIPMMLNPCLVTQSFNNSPSNSPFTSGVIRSSVPLLSYPYYPPDQQPPGNASADQDRVDNNTQCSYSYATQTTQTTQTNSPIVNNSSFTEANCEGVQQIDDTPESYEPAVDPFVNEKIDSHHEPQKDGFDINDLTQIHNSRESRFLNNKISGILKPVEETLVDKIHEEPEDPFESENVESIHETTIDSFVDGRVGSGQEEEQLDHISCAQDHVENSENNLMGTSHSLGTVISNTHRLIANDPTLDYDQDLRADDIDYADQSYSNLSPSRNMSSPVSDVSNWSSGSGLRVRRDLSNLDEQGNNCIQYVHPDSNAAEFVTCDPYGDETSHQATEGQLTNLDNVNYSVVLDYNSDQHTPRMSLNESQNKEENSVQPLNIHSDELMPPRGELSGQESLGATENSIWELQDNGESSATSYPLLGKERWQILSSAIQEDLNESYSNDVALAERNHSVKCLECDMKFTCVKERRIHVQTVHNTPRYTQVKIEGIASRPNKYEMKLGKAQIIKIKQERLNLKTEASVKTCLECGLELQSMKELRKHKREFHEVKRKCGTCEMVFSDSLLFKDHIAKIHPIECNVCGKFFPTKAAANTHAKSHLKLKPFQCTVCDKSFISRMKLNDHNNIHSGEAPYKCPMCDQTFRRQSNLIQHKNFFHLKIKKKIKDYFCHCGEIFHSIKKLQWHKEIHDAKPKQCIYCSERYIHTTSLTRHIRHSHDSTYLPKTTKSLNILCPICKITCIRSSLAQHMKIHTGDKPFTCNVCSKEFSTNWNLQMHKWTHASRNSKPYKCKQCKCAFYMLSSYQAHVRSHRNIRPYTCNYCGRQFIRKYNCVRHVKEHETNKSYCCAVCNKTFHRSYYLTEHMRTHTGVKPYTCHICSKTSSTKSNHNKHVRTHHAREPVNTEG